MNVSTFKPMLTPSPPVESSPLAAYAYTRARPGAIPAEDQLGLAEDEVTNTLASH